MATCILTIEIDEPSRVRVGGETVTGTVVVHAEKDVNCKGLEVSCCWMTHGQGNVARGDAETQTLYQGEWQSGQVYRYPFKLKSSTWPPSYYGNYLNVGHYITAHAKLPWKLDPKAQQEFPLVATETPADLMPTQTTKSHSRTVGWIVGALVLATFLVAMLPLFFILLPIVVIGGVIFWFVQVFLPRRITGPVDLLIEPREITVGNSLTGRLEFTPRTNTHINGIRWTIRCVEKCSSGSGSSRTTHTHEVLRKEITLMEAGQLIAGTPHHYELSFAVPKTAPPSLKFTDNELTWGSQLRIDIPRWPDWVKELPFVVKVSSSNTPLNMGPPLIAVLESDTESRPSTASVVVPHDDNDPWFTEVLQQILHAESDDERLRKILEAVADQEFAIVVDTQGEVDEPLDSDIDEESIWVAAVDKARNVRFALSIPQGIEAEKLLWSNDWQAMATVHGFDSETGRIMMQIVRV